MLLQGLESEVASRPRTAVESQVYVNLLMGVTLDINSIKTGTNPI